MKNLTNDELIQHLANALHTEAICLGHKKAARNEEAVAQYRVEADKRGLTVPGRTELYAMGQFNGPGST